MKPIVIQFVSIFCIVFFVYSCNPPKGDPGPTGNANVIDGIFTVPGSAWLPNNTTATGWAADVVFPNQSYNLPISGSASFQVYYLKVPLVALWDTLEVPLPGYSGGTAGLSPSFNFSYFLIKSGGNYQMTLIGVGSTNNINPGWSPAVLGTSLFKYVVVPAQ
jgi:hypothetical protein